MERLTNRAYFIVINALPGFITLDIAPISPVDGIERYIILFIAAALELVNVLVTRLTIFFSINVETGSTSCCRGTAPPSAGFYSSDFNRPTVIAVSTVDVVAGVGRAMLQGHVVARSINI